MKVGDIVKVTYTLVTGAASERAPAGLILKREYDFGDLQYLGERRCFILFTDGIKAWVNEKDLTVISSA